MAQTFSAEQLSTFGLWMDGDDLDRNPEQRREYERLSAYWERVIFGPESDKLKEEVMRDVIRAKSQGDEQKMYFISKFATYRNQYQSWLTNHKEDDVVVQHRDLSVFLMLVRTYAEIFDVGLYYLFSHTNVIDNIHIVGTAMTCIHEDGRCLLATLPYTKTVSGASKLTNQYASRVGKRVDIAFPHNNLDTPRAHRMAVRIKTPADGFIANIRLHRASNPTQKGMVDYGFITWEALNFIQRLVRTALPGMISGAPGSAKTTFLRTLIYAMPPWEPVFIVEHAPELFVDSLLDDNQRPWLKIVHAHVVQGANSEGVGAIPFAEIFQWGLQEDVRRFVVGEIADRESMSTFIHALQTGQSGALATIHANSVEDTVNRMATLLASEYQREVAWENIGTNLRWIVHCAIRQPAQPGQRVTRFVTGIGLVIHREFGSPPQILHAYRRDATTHALERADDFDVCLSILQNSERERFGETLGDELPKDRPFRHTQGGFHA